MNDSIAIQLTRREFVAASGAVTGMLMMPSSLIATPAAGGADKATRLAGPPSASCEFSNVAGILRPHAWRLAGGPSLELVTMNDGVTGVRLTNALGSDEQFSSGDLQFGRPQEMIRHHFGDDVLCQVVEEIERHRQSMIRPVRQINRQAV